MKQKFILRIIILMFLVSAVSTVSACHKKAERFSVVYKAAEGGHIEGKTEQSVLYGESAEAVTAVPNEGYEFAGWSDEVTTATRRDNSVTAVAEYVALFRRITSSVSYTADIGGYIEGKTEQSVLYGESAEAVTAVPNEGYEFAGWSDGAAMAARR
ncbi:MAG: InlB B-repeat-containing protein, partial [Clostridiales bacterium]|nr:InlB B-repeat-containing protein [Clostridiales bacterium]